MAHDTGTGNRTHRRASMPVDHLRGAELRRRRRERHRGRTKARRRALPIAIAATVHAAPCSGERRHQRRRRPAASIHGPTTVLHARVLQRRRRAQRRRRVRLGPRGRRRAAGPGEVRRGGVSWARQRPGEDVLPSAHRRKRARLRTGGSMTSAICNIDLFNKSGRLTSLLGNDAQHTTGWGAAVRGRTAEVGRSSGGGCPRTSCCRPCARAEEGRASQNSTHIDGPAPASVRARRAGIRDSPRAAGRMRTFYTKGLPERQHRSMMAPLVEMMSNCLGPNRSGARMAFRQPSAAWYDWTP